MSVIYLCIRPTTAFEHWRFFASMLYLVRMSAISWRDSNPGTQWAASQFIPSHFRTRDNSYPRQFVPATFHTQTILTRVSSYPRQFVPASVRTRVNSYPRQFVPATIRTRDNSYPDNSYPRQFVPATIHTRDNSYPWQFVPATIRTRDISYPDNSYPWQFVPGHISYPRFPDNFCTSLHLSAPVYTSMQTFVSSLTTTMASPRQNLSDRVILFLENSILRKVPKSKAE